MKKIEAYIRHEAFEPIRAELLDKGFPSLSIIEAKGSGRQKGIVERYRGSTLTVNVRPKIKLEVVVEDKDKDIVVEAILRHARTGEVGDGKIFVLPVEEAIRIRTGEDGQEVLQRVATLAHPRHDPCLSGGSGGPTAPPDRDDLLLRPAFERRSRHPAPARRLAKRDPLVGHGAEASHSRGPNDERGDRWPPRSCCLGVQMRTRRESPNPRATAGPALRPRRCGCGSLPPPAGRRSCRPLPRP